MRITYALVFFSLLFLNACKNESTTTENLAPIDPNIHANIIRFEQLLHSGNLQKAKEEAPGFYNLYFHEILGIPDTSLFTIVNKEIVQDTVYQSLYRAVEHQYVNLGSLQNEINQALENYLRVFQLPKSALPNIYTFISGFNYQTLVFDDAGKDGVGVGLEMFLGDDFPYRSAMPNNPLSSDYLTRTYNANHMVKKIVEVLIEDQLPPPSRGDFLSLMIWGGKKLYIMDEILDFKSDTIVTEYTAEQLEWCQHNQLEMWNLFFDKDLFYSTDFRKFNKLISPAPTSPDMPPESPGRTGNYMGWQVVQSFMRRHLEYTALDLIKINDAQLILDGARYKPGR